MKQSVSSMKQRGASNPESMSQATKAQNAKKAAVKKKAKAPFIGYGTNVKAGKAITKSVKKKVVKTIVKDAKSDGMKAAKLLRKSLPIDNPAPGSPTAKYRAAVSKMDAARGTKSLYGKVAKKTFKNRNK